MNNLDVKVAVQGMDKVSTLIDLIMQYEHELPGDLLRAVVDLADCEHCEVGIEQVLEMGFVSARCVADGVDIECVRSVNKILKRVDAGIHIFPKTLKLIANDGTIILEW